MPIQVARAYGVKPARTAAPVRQVESVRQVRPIERAAEQQINENIEKLIAGTVKGPVDFSAASTPTSPAGAYQLYTRAADKVEASMAVQVGRAIDIKG